MIMGWLAAVDGARQAKPDFTNIGPSLCLDDSRFTSSSQDAALTANIATSEYAALTGVILETKKNSNSTTLATPPEEQQPRLQQARKGTLLGGGPRR